MPQENKNTSPDTKEKSKKKKKNEPEVKKSAPKATKKHEATDFTLVIKIDFADFCNIIFGNNDFEVYNEPSQDENQLTTIERDVVSIIEGKRINNNIKRVVGKLDPFMKAAIHCYNAEGKLLSTLSI